MYVERVQRGLREISGFEPVLINSAPHECKWCHVCLITYSHMWDVFMAQSKYLFMISVVAVTPAHTRKTGLEGISDFPENDFVLPEEKHENCQLIEPFQTFQNTALSLLPSIFFRLISYFKCTLVFFPQSAVSSDLSEIMELSYSKK